MILTIRVLYLDWSTNDITSFQRTNNKNMKTKSKIIIAITTLICIGGSIFYFEKRKKKKKVTKKEETKPVEVEIKPEVVESDLILEAFKNTKGFRSREEFFSIFMLEFSKFITDYTEFEKVPINIDKLEIYVKEKDISLYKKYLEDLRLVYC